MLDYFLNEEGGDVESVIASRKGFVDGRPIAMHLIAVDQRVPSLFPLFQELGQFPLKSRRFSLEGQSATLFYTR